MCVYGLGVLGSGILFNKDVSAIRRGLRIDFHSLRNSVIIYRGCSNGVGLLAVISTWYEDFAIWFGLGAPFPLLRAADAGERWFVLLVFFFKFCYFLECFVSSIVGCVVTITVCTFLQVSPFFSANMSAKCSDPHFMQLRMRWQ